MRKTKVIALSLALILMLNVIMPLATVIAAPGDPYTISFEAEDGHTIVNDEGNLKIDDQIVELKNASNERIGVIEVQDSKHATITVSDGTPGQLTYFSDNKFVLCDVNNNHTPHNIDNYYSTNMVFRVEDAPSVPDTVTFQLDEATVSGNVITFDVDGTNVTATIVGEASDYTITQTVENEKVKYSLVIEYVHINEVKLALGNNFDNNTMRVQLHDGQQLVVSGGNEVVFDGLDFTNDSAPHLQIIPFTNVGPSGEDTQNYHGNSEATLNYSINGAIEYTAGNGYDHGIGFRINGIQYRMDEEKVTYSEELAYERDGHGQYILNENNERIPVLDPETMQQMNEKTGLTVNGDTIHYDSQGDTVDFVFTMAPGTLMTSLTINGVPVDLPDERAELEACYRDHALEIPARGIAKANTYIIAIEARYPNSDEEILGNFLWDYNPQGYTSPEDKVLNATVTLVEAEYNGKKLTTPKEVNDEEGVFIWRDAERKKVYTNEDAREGVGEAQFPVGTKLTVRIIPDAGYQLVDFGVNGGVFDPQDEIGTYTFEVEGGPFHLQATIAQVDDVVKTESEKIAGGLIEFGGKEESMQIGTARLDVKDVELNKEQISNFEGAAEGYDVKNYIDISLYNTVFKGKETESWDTQVKDLQNEATITLKLEDGVNVEDVVIVHEKHDGTYEIIEIESYDKENNTITFKTKSFSNYAIATKADVATEEAKAAEEEPKINNPKTIDNIMTYVEIFIISTIAMGIVIRRRKK